MTYYTPDAYRVLSIQQEDGSNLIKIFGSWNGGYLDGDSWRLNSGTKDIVETFDKYRFHGYSGSVYEVNKNQGKLTSYNAHILDGFLKHEFIKVVSVEEAIKTLEELKNE